MSTPELKLVPKPEGYDMRARRADKVQDARAWQAPDALYSANEQINEAIKAGRDIDCIVVCWREREADEYTTKFRQASNFGASAALLISVLGKIMGWR